VSLGVRNTAARELILAGGAQIGGSLTVTGGNGGLNVREAGAAVHVTKNATFVGGNGPDQLFLSWVGGTSVGLTLTVLKFNEVRTNPGDMIGRLSFNAAGEATHNLMNLWDTEVLGSLNYVGGTRSDTIELGMDFGNATHIRGDVRVNFGTQLGSDFSVFVIQDGPGNQIDGRLWVTGSPLGTDNVSLGGTVEGAVTLNLGGGTNQVNLSGVFNGPAFAYTGGAGADTISYAPTPGSGRARFTARLGDGADIVSLGTATTNPSFAFIDFGAGADTFTGTVNFDSQFLNLT
jgi:hypothetical protein